ncbi:golgi-body localization protein domain-containing protein [Hysterangium stoloniferum]|nr:golgi-body localization protein domain-containing protein [Hysterangium stoloniferum]
MQPLLEVWYITSRLGAALLFNPPGLTGWAAWFTTLIRTLVVIALFRRNLAPFLLARISRHVRARSISIRSIRGLYVCGMGRTWKAERISWSFHPWAQSGMSIKVEGLYVIIAQTNPIARERGIVKQTAGAKIFTVLLTVIVTILTPLNWFIRWYLLKRSLGYLQRFLYSTSITTSQLFIQYLPSLTQNIDLEVDSISISFQDLAYAQVVLKDILVGVKVDLSQMGRSLEQNLSKGVQENTNDLAEASKWNTRFRTNADRFWERIWGQTEILTMFNVSIHDITGRLGSKPANIFDNRVFETQAASHSNSDIFVRVPAILQLSMSLQFSPRLRTFKPNTLEFSLTLQEVEIYAEKIKQLLLQEDQGRRGSEIILVATPTSPSSISPTSPVSPFISAFSQISRFTILKSVDVWLASIKVVHSSPSGKLSSYAHVLTAKQVMIHLGPTAGTSNLLHRKWFGSKPFTPMDVPVYGLTSSIGVASISRIRNTVSEPLISSLFLLEGLQLDLIAHQWPQALIAVSPTFLAEDPNAPFLACEMHISSVDVSDQVGELKASLDTLLPSNSGKRTVPLSSSPIQSTPRIHFECLCDNLRFCLVTVSEQVNAVFSLDVPGANFTLSTSFQTIGRVPNSDISLHMDTHFSMFFGPILLRAGLNHEHGVDVDALGRHWEGLENLLVIDAMDLTVNNKTKGHFVGGSVVTIEPDTSLSDVRLVVDAVSIEIWNAVVISAIGTFFEATRSGKDEPAPSLLNFDGLPSGLFFHFAIACFTIVVTGPDLNPECNLELARGLQLRNGIALKYHSNGSPIPGQVKDQKLLEKLRDNLYTSEVHSLHAMPLADAEILQDDVLALIRVFVWDTACHNALSTPFEVGNSSRNMNDHAFLVIPRTVLSARLLRDITPLSPKAKDSVDVSLHISHVRGHLDLLNAYSTLLVWQTLRSWIPRRSKRPGVQGSHSPDISLAIQISNIHILCRFPLKEQLFIQAAALSVHHSPSESLINRCESIVAYVPSAQVTNEWEELLRLQHVACESTKQSHNTKWEVSLQGLRLAIPYDYVLSELILNAAVAVKAVRHLYCIVQLGQYTPLPTPVAEGPKQTPAINVTIHSVTVEAADSPFEAKLALIWRTGAQAQRIRIERELAFEAKLQAVMASGDVEENFDFSPQSDLRYHFTSRRTTSVSDARDRLNMVHSTSWINVITHQKEEISRKEENMLKSTHQSVNTEVLVPLPVIIHMTEKAPPLFRARLTGVQLSLSAPDFPSGYAGFLQELGDLPRATEYSLLVPLQVRCTLDAATINIRDYYLPLLNVPSSTIGPSLVFETTLIVAEEMGSADSVEWLRCPIVPDNAGIIGAHAFCLSVPKTIMPVKSYASPLIKFCTAAVTEFTWGVSYNPAIQEIMRVIETLSHPSRDPSPSIGFWDKLRLVFHWRIRATFEGGAQLHFKGSRDPHHVTDVGAGFDFRWDGHVSLQIACQNDEMELIQLTSDSMMITIPDYEATLGSATDTGDMSGCKEASSSRHEVNDRKICAKFSNGIRWGIGVSLERTCDASCITCHGDSFSRRCRFFSFVPHHKVVLHTPGDTATVSNCYAGFRSNFIHFSTSLTSPLNKGSDDTNSFHLTPKTFAHFWSWWHLFDGALSLPIRQGNLFPKSRPPTKKFGHHLATIKYRINFSSIYVAHVYKIDSTADWAAGESHCVGVKAFLENFQADLHQREEEITTYKRDTQGSKTIRHKSFSTVDVVLSGLDLRAIFAIFAEPEKCSIPMRDSAPNSTKFWETLEPVSLSSTWMDADDFVELDWIAVDNEPILYIHQGAVCPRFMYFKRTPRSSSVKDDQNISQSKTKFGDEDTHVCLMGKQQSGHDVQVQFAADRLAELRSQLDELAGSQRSSRTQQSNSTDQESRSGTETNIAQMILLVEQYIQHLSELRDSSSTATSGKQFNDLYAMPADIMLPQEVKEFANVYQVHCPKIHLNNATRDILQQYYIASRARRGFEYHMSARAVKFIRDQALSIHPDLAEEQETVKRRPRAGSAHAAAQAVRRMLIGDERHKADGTRSDKNHAQKLTEGDPLYGWDQGVLKRKAHLCVLLKPQIVLRSGRHERSTLVLVSDHVVLRNYGILDKANADDPVSGYVMQRNYASIDNLQMFQPTSGSVADHLPLEVFLDVKCESRDFERLVPQTRATLRYDKFNRLRLRNDVTTVAISAENGGRAMVDHLSHEMDLLAIDVPRFSISADAAAFAAMADVVTDLLLFSDPVHKALMTQLETMLFSYDFTDLRCAAQVVSDLQARLRRLLHLEETYSFHQTDDDQYTLLASKAHIFKLSQKLNLIFDAIRLAQVKTDDRSQDKKSALSLRFSSSEISWRMLDENKELLAKLAVRGINYSWLSRQDGSTVSVLSAADLQAFDGSPWALLPEILAKYHEPPGHHMIRRGLFVEAQWSVLAPVGGISIYDHFKVQLHPIRLALETNLGSKLVEYLIPGRRSRQEASQLDSSEISHHSNYRPTNPRRTSDGGDVNSLPQLAIHPPQETVLHSMNPAVLSETTSRRPRLVASRSFSNLKSNTADFGNVSYHAPGLPRSSSSVALVSRRDSSESNDNRTSDNAPSVGEVFKKAEGDASEMRHRSAQKTFVHVEIASVHVLLSVMKGRGFLVRDARLRTHDLEWRNRTSSFEELFSQFIPSDPSLRGWVKVAWQQPVFSVGGVVKELIIKTQWGRLGKESDIDAPTLVRRKSDRSRARTVTGTRVESSRSFSPHPFPQTSASASSDAAEMRTRQRSSSRPRVSSLFKRSKSGKRSIDTEDIPSPPAKPEG